jgi:hypothetical protein
LEQPSTKAKQVSNRVNDDTNLKENTPLLWKLWWKMILWAHKCLSYTTNLETIVKLNDLIFFNTWNNLH